MNIVMLGHSGVGKTTYMASMYGVLQSSINGFSLRTEDSSDHERLVKNFYSIKKNYYPDLTAMRSEYRFCLYHQGNKVFPFRWVDYRGGAITERKDSSEQAKTLHKDLLNANGVIVFIDYPTLISVNIRKSGIQRLINSFPFTLRPTEVDSNIRKSGIQRLISLLSVTLKEISHPIPVAIVLTKADMVSNLSKREMNVLNPLLESIKAGDNIVGTIIPIACGKKMMNVEIPLLFNLFIGIRYKLAQLSQYIEECVGDAKRYRDKGGFWDELGSVISRTPSWYDLANRKIRDAQREYEILQKLEPSAEALGNYLEGCPIF